MTPLVMSKINKPSVYVCTHVCTVTELASHGTSFDLCTGGSCPTEEQYQDVTGFGGAGLSPSDLFYSELELKGLVGIEPTFWLIHTSEIMFFVFSYSEIENLALTVKEKGCKFTAIREQSCKCERKTKKPALVRTESLWSVRL